MFFLTPIIMKKSRPANKLSVLCSAAVLDTMRSLVFTHSTTIGIRTYKVEKTMLQRLETTIDTSLGKVAVKYSYLQGKQLRMKPEATEIARLAAEHGLSMEAVLRTIEKETP